MALLLYVLVGFVISLVFFLVPNAEIDVTSMYFFLIIFWFPLFLAGLVVIAVNEPKRYSF